MPSYAASSSAHMRCMSRSLSRRTCTRVPGGSPVWSSYSSRHQPQPTPNTNRPPLSWSRVAIALASTMGSCSAARLTAVPISRSVVAATAARVMYGSGMCLHQSGMSPRGERLLDATGIWVCSHTNIDANPRSAANRATSPTGMVLSVMCGCTPNVACPRPEPMWFPPLAQLVALLGLLPRTDVQAHVAEALDHGVTIGHVRASVVVPVPRPGDAVDPLGAQRHRHGHSPSLWHRLLPTAHM